MDESPQKRLDAIEVRWMRLQSLNMLIATVAALGGVAVAAVVLVRQGIVWGVVTLFASPLLVSCVALPVMLGLGHAMFGRDGIAGRR